MVQKHRVRGRPCECGVSVDDGDPRTVRTARAGVGLVHRRLLFASGGKERREVLSQGPRYDSLPEDGPSGPHDSDAR